MLIILILLFVIGLFLRDLNKINVEEILCQIEIPKNEVPKNRYKQSK